MPIDDRRFLPSDGKRLVLVVDDEAINREMLGFMLRESYHVIYAENGAEALEKIKEHRKTLSLILLDVLMPVMDGFTLLETIKADAELQRIPVIVLTTEPTFELRCLQLGAADFIKKPYDLPEVVLARVDRIIALSERTDMIRSTQRDSLTGTFNREFFFQYIKQIDLYHPDAKMDAIALDVVRFHAFNDLYGHDAGDELLRCIGRCVRDYALDCDGIVCREEADRFLLYCPHREDYDRFLRDLHARIEREISVQAPQIRAGVYPNADAREDARRRFDYANLALKSLGGDGRQLAIYDAELHEKHLFSQKLLDGIKAALKEDQFLIYYQPKYDIRGEKPLLVSAEALVRWKHPKFGMISPGLFIPLFEEQGLISRLDHYVWEKTAAQIRRWREKFGASFPVSVNVSRVDLFDPKICEYFTELIRKNGLDFKDMHLEITESAYTENTNLITDTVRRLRELGFMIEMDDFGTGYSSLNMLAEMPIDVLKLDMAFAKKLEENGKNRYILELLLRIKDHLQVPAIAEGVETAEQVAIFREMGCDIIQGYFFSPPVPAEAFEEFLKERFGRC